MRIARTARSVSHVSERHTIRERVLCMVILIVHTKFFLPPLKHVRPFRTTLR